MPRQRQRIVFCDCFDCRDRADEPELTSEQLDAATAVARQEPPPKALILYAPGFVLDEDGTTTLDVCTLPHCDLLVREGNLGLLAVRRAQDAPDPDAALTPAAVEVAQLLGVFKDPTSQHGPPSEVDRQLAPLPSLAARFKGMQAALASSSALVRTLAQRQGITLLQDLCIGPGSGTVLDVGAGGGAGGGAAADGVSGSAPVGPGTHEDGVGAAPGVALARGALDLPDVAAYARRVAAELGASEGSSGRDLVLLHWDLADLLAGGRRAGEGGPEDSTIVATGGGSTTGELPQEQQQGAVTEQRAMEADGGGGGGSGPAVESAAGRGAVVDGETRWDAGCEALEWLDGLIRSLMGLPEIRERTLLVLMLSPAGQQLSSVRPQGMLVGAAAAGANAGSGGGGGAPGALVLHPGGMPLDPGAAVVTPRNTVAAGSRSGGFSAAAAATTTGPLSALDSEELPLVSRPIQSFEFLGLDRVAVDLGSPVLVARRLPGVVRRDRAERLSYKEALAAGGQGVVLLERLLPEVAFKVGRAPKYGA